MEAQETSAVNEHGEKIPYRMEKGLIAHCSGCGKAGAPLYEPSLGIHHFCPECAKRTTLLDKAEKHLLELIRKEVLPVWAEQYKAQGLGDKELKEAVKGMAHIDWFEGE
jgi:hypothetical protein